jgi:WD40 repeat protein
MASKSTPILALAVEPISADNARVLFAVGALAEVWNLGFNETDNKSTLQASHSMTLPSDTNSATARVLSVALGTTYMITGDEDGIATIWSRGSGGAVWSLREVHDGPLLVVGWTSSSEAFTAGEDRQVVLWNYPHPVREESAYLSLRIVPDWGFKSAEEHPDPEYHSVVLTGISWSRAVRTHCVWATDRLTPYSDFFIATVEAVYGGPAVDLVTEVVCPLPSGLLIAADVNALHVGLSTDGGRTALPVSKPFGLWERPHFISVHPKHVTRHGGQSVQLRGKLIPPTLRAQCLLHLESQTEPVLVEAVVKSSEIMIFIADILKFHIGFGRMGGAAENDLLCCLSRASGLGDQASTFH